MRSAMNSLIPLLAALFALGVLGMPEGVAAQDGCTECLKEDNGPPECVPKLEGDGVEEDDLDVPYLVRYAIRRP